MNNYFKQIWYELRYQRMVTITSVMGTAFAIFFVMAVFMVSSIDTVPVAPESNRPRLLYGKSIHINKQSGSSGSGCMSYKAATALYGNLEGIEKISYCGAWNNTMDASVKDDDCISMLRMKTDDIFWEIFDFKFIAGKPFDKATIDSRLNEIIIQKSSAIKLFGSTDIVGKEVKLNHVPYIVRGVVDDTSPLMAESYANIYIPYAPENEGEGWLDGYGGDTKVIMLMSPDSKYEDIKSQVKGRYATLDAILKKTGGELIYHQTPYTAESVTTALGSNADPDTESPRRMRYITYLLLLILPAINLSSMTRSRLRQRVSEIGVRRAYGATKRSIINRFLEENLILTLAGGIIGFALCLIFIALFSNLFISYGGIFAAGDALSARPTFAMLLNFKSFGLALIFCLILNLLSTGFPAWRASRINPAEAISGKND